MFHAFVQQFVTLAEIEIRRDFEIVELVVPVPTWLLLVGLGAAALVMLAIVGFVVWLLVRERRRRPEA